MSIDRLAQSDQGHGLRHTPRPLFSLAWGMALELRGIARDRGRVRDLRSGTFNTSAPSSTGNPGSPVPPGTGARRPLP
jgi:hypothetical protein